MKKLIFLIALIGISSINLIAQEINFTFNPKDATNTIDSIRAINISTGKTAFVSGSNVISLNSSTTGINNIERRSVHFNVFPNPFDYKTELQFYSEQDNNITVFLTNSLGQIVAKSNQYVTSGAHSFEISINSEGLYIVNVVGNQIKYSQKIIASGNNQNSNKIEYQGITSHSKMEKSVTIEDASVIHFMIYSGEKITKIADAPTESKTYNVEFIECKDADGRSYPIVQIGEQWWMAENLAYLPEIGNGYYVYDYDGLSVIDAKNTINYKTYGVLYSWYSAKISCPNGWHLADNEEWEQLARFIAYQKGYPVLPDFRFTYWYKGGKNLKSTGTIEDGDGLWAKSTQEYEIITYNVVGTNEYGFSAIPGGDSGNVYSDEDVLFGGKGEYCYFWTSVGNGEYRAFYISIGLDGNIYGAFNFINSDYDNDEGKHVGMSVRCIKD